MEHVQGPCPLGSRSPGGHLEAPLGLSTLDPVPHETAPRRRPRDEGRSDEPKESSDDTSIRARGGLHNHILALGEVV